MPDFGAEAPFIWWSYGLAALAMTIAVVWLVVQGRWRARELSELSDGGTKDRSET